MAPPSCCTSPPLLPPLSTPSLLLLPSHLLTAPFCPKVCLHHPCRLSLRPLLPSLCGLPSLSTHLCGLHLCPGSVPGLCFEPPLGLHQLMHLLDPQGPQPLSQQHLAHIHPPDLLPSASTL